MHFDISKRKKSWAGARLFCVTELSQMHTAPGTHSGRYVTALFTSAKPFSKHLPISNYVLM